MKYIVIITRTLMLHTVMEFESYEQAELYVEEFLKEGRSYDTVYIAKVEYEKQA